MMAEEKKQRRIDRIDGRTVLFLTLCACIVTFFATSLGYVLGLPLGICLAVTNVDGIAENKGLYKVLDFLMNSMLSRPRDLDSFALPSTFLE